MWEAMDQPHAGITCLGAFVAREIVTLRVLKFNMMALTINLILIPKNDDAVVML